MAQEKTLLDKYGFPQNSPISPGTAPTAQIPWEFGMRQKLQGKQAKLSRINIKSPFQLSAIANGQGIVVNGQTALFQTILSPRPPHSSEMQFSIPYVALYWNVAGIAGSQIWPYLGAGIPGTAFTVTAGYDWHLFSVGIPGSVSASFSGIVTNNSMGSGTIQLVTQWQSINFNSGTVVTA